MIDEPISKPVESEPSHAISGFFRDIDVEFLVHELKNPISVIETAVRMLLERPEKYGALSSRQEKTLKRALRNSKKARTLLADLLEVGRSDAGCIQCCRFGPAAVVDGVLMEAVEESDVSLWEELHGISEGEDRADAMSRKGIVVTCSDIARRVELIQDEAKFRQIVGNLIKNALRHRRHRLELGLDCRGNDLILEVVDDGPGVEKENREAIFQRYTRLKECAILSRTGHGLGLAGARILARHLGGDITVYSHNGPGAAFCLTLPITLQDKD